jgi:ADP-dependent NAD(P)H-hydrate dehydratase / NAD(P)H-hydrate epimerase
MKILPIEKIREADAYTIAHEPVSDIDLMERAAQELCDWISAEVSPERKILIFCGMGNNGGDGFALARLLCGRGFVPEVFVVRYSETMSPSCQTNYERAKQITKLRISELTDQDNIPEIERETVIVDALFGSGLTRPVKGLAGKVIRQINASGSDVIAVDVPSGFFCDQSNAGNEGEIVRACNTLTFQFPKLGFLFPENDTYVGQWEVLDIGLHPGFIEKVEVENYYILSHHCYPMLRSRKRFAHKGTFGHGLLIAGSYGKMGSAVLAAEAALRAGAGLITAHIPYIGNTVLQTAIPEVMLSIDENEKVFSRHPSLDIYHAIAIGPGIGTDPKTVQALKLLIQDAGIPLIFDADAINILSENKTWLSFIRPNSIFTPHIKEFERLVGKSANDFERNKKQREFSVRYGVFVVLKGGHTSITTPDGTCWFNSTGNPGMATGGSGDVLTGILLGHSAQGYSSHETSILGVFIHGLAGDLAARKYGQEALIAGDIIRNLGKSFRKLWKAWRDGTYASKG